MMTVFIRERSFCTPQSLAETLGEDESFARLCIEVLTTRGVLKLKSGNELSEYDTDQGQNIEGTYQFVYVGLVLFKHVVIVVYPKYLNGDDVSVKRLSRIFRVIRHYAGSKSHIAALSDGGRRANDRLALMLTLLDRFGEHGLYGNQIRAIKTNGAGFISWERTIAKHQPFAGNAAPVYFDYETVENTSDVSNYVTRLHKCVLTECSRFMRKSGLSDLLSLVDIDLSDETLEDLGDKDFINYRLEQERRQQFITWKQEVIDLLTEYINEDESVVQSDECICLGSSSFHVIWEKSCKVAFGDQLDMALQNLGISIAPAWKEHQARTLLGIVPCPKWTTVLSNGDEGACGDVSTLVPDAVCLRKMSDGSVVFCIYDAKYYTPTLGTSVYGVPGVESVTKQFLYQSAYASFVRDHGFADVVNAFLVPGDIAEPMLMGRVRFPEVLPDFGYPFGKHVDMWMIPAAEVFDAYLTDSRLPSKMLRKLSSR